jgi:hypothetical protein
MSCFLKPHPKFGGLYGFVDGRQHLRVFDESGFAGLLFSSDPQLFTASLIFSLQVSFWR